jgi:hypothetical protein
MLTQKHLKNTGNRAENVADNGHFPRLMPIRNQLGAFRVS